MRVMSDCFFPVRGAEVADLGSRRWELVGVAPERPGVESWLSAELVRSMLTALRSFRGVRYVLWLFCVFADLADAAGEVLIWSLGVMGRSCDDTVEVLGRLVGAA